MCRQQTGEEKSPLWEWSALGAAFPPKALVFFEANLPFLKNQVLLPEASTRSRPEETLPTRPLLEPVPRAPFLPCLPSSASEGVGAGLPLLPLAVAPPGDGVKAAGPNK